MAHRYFGLKANLKQELLKRGIRQVRKSDGRIVGLSQAKTIDLINAAK